MSFFSKQNNQLIEKENYFELKNQKPKTKDEKISYFIWSLVFKRILVIQNGHPKKLLKKLPIKNYNKDITHTHIHTKRKYQVRL